MKTGVAMSENRDTEIAFEEARTRAREVVSDVYPGAIEVDEATGEMILFDGVSALDRDGCEVGAVNHHARRG